MIKVEALTKSFGRQAVLRGLDLEVATGSITVIIGRSGGGKSVLLKHLIGLLRPDAGRVLVDGAEITGLRGRALDEIRRRYGVVFQGGALFDSMTCFDNVAFPLREKRRPRRGAPPSPRPTTPGPPTLSFSRSATPTFSPHPIQSNSAPPWNTTP